MHQTTNVGIATASSLQSKINQNEAAIDHQEHLYLAKQKPAATPPAKPVTSPPAKPVKSPPVKPKPPATSSGSGSSAAGSAAPTSIAKLEKGDQLLVAELNIAKRNEQAAQAANTAPKKNPVPDKPATSGTGIGSVYNKVATGAKNLVVDTFNLAVGDDAKMAFGKDNTFLEKSVGSLSLIFTAVTLGEAGVIKSTIKGAIQTTEKALTKKWITTAVVKDAADVAGTKVTRQGAKETGQVLKKETLSSSSGGINNLEKGSVPAATTAEG